MKPMVLVLGANGKTGKATALQLLEKGYPVRAFLRRKDARSYQLKAKGADLFYGDMNSLNDLTEALIGVKRAYFVAPWEPEQLSIASTFAVAAKNSPSLEAIVAISQWLSHPAHPSIATRETYLTDEIFAMLPNITHTTINVGWLADNYMPDALIMMITQLGIFPFPLGQGKTAPISNEDVAKVIVACLESPRHHADKIYRPTGPDLLSPQEIAGTFGRILNKKVKYQNISETIFLKALKMMKMSDYMQSQLQHYIHEYQLGTFELGAPNQTFEQLTGTQPESFETIAKRYLLKPKFKATLSNKLSAIAGFIKLILSSPTNLKRYEKEHGYTASIKTIYSFNAEDWKLLHTDQL